MNRELQMILLIVAKVTIQKELTGATRNENVFLLSQLVATIQQIGVERKKTINWLQSK